MTINFLAFGKKINCPHWGANSRPSAFKLVALTTARCLVNILQKELPVRFIDLKFNAQVTFLVKNLHVHYVD